MALKFSQFKKSSNSRIVDSISDCNIEYTSHDGKTLVVPAKLIALECGLRGYITNERYPEIESAFTGDENDNMILPDGWKVGSPKNGLHHGFWYNSEELKPTTRTAKEIPF